MYIQLYENAVHSSFHRTFTDDELCADSHVFFCDSSVPQDITQRPEDFDLSLCQFRESCAVAFSVHPKPRLNAKVGVPTDGEE